MNHWMVFLLLLLTFLLNATTTNQLITYHLKSLCGNIARPITLPSSLTHLYFRDDSPFKQQLNCLPSTVTHL